MFCLASYSKMEDEKFTKFEEFVYKNETNPVFLLIFMGLGLLFLASPYFIIPWAIWGIFVIFMWWFSNKRKLFERKLKSEDYY